MSKLKFAAVQFYSDEKIIVVPTKDVVDFQPLDEYEGVSFFVWREHVIEGQIQYQKSAAQIIDVAESKHSLTKYITTQSDLSEQKDIPTKFKFIKKRLSDVVQTILQREGRGNDDEKPEDEDKNLEKPTVVTKSGRKRRNKNASEESGSTAKDSVQLDHTKSPTSKKSKNLSKNHVTDGREKSQPLEDSLKKNKEKKKKNKDVSNSSAVDDLKKQNEEMYGQEPLYKSVLQKGLSKLQSNQVDTLKKTKKYPFQPSDGKLFDIDPSAAEAEHMAKQLIEISKENNDLKNMHQETVANNEKLTEHLERVLSENKILKENNEEQSQKIEKLNQEFVLLKEAIKNNAAVTQKRVDDLPSPLSKESKKKNISLSPTSFAKVAKLQEEDDVIPVESGVDNDFNAEETKSKKKKKKSKHLGREKKTKRNLNESSEKQEIDTKQDDDFGPIESDVENALNVEETKSKKKNKKSKHLIREKPTYSNEKQEIDIKKESIPTTHVKKESIPTTRAKGDGGRFTESQLNQFRSMSNIPDKKVWYDEKNNNKKMFHLSCGESVPYDEWDRAVKRATSASKHLTASVSVMWSGDSLLDRALDPESCKSNRLPGRPPRKEFSPKRLAACQIAYDDVCHKKYSGDQLMKEKKLFRSRLSSYINRLITNEKNRLIEEQAQKLKEEKEEKKQRESEGKKVRQNSSSASSTENTSDSESDSESASESASG